jgi:hypothetical protein
MSNLKTQNVNKCLSLLRQFISEVPEQDKKKDTALLALNQLQNITAGQCLEGTSDPGVTSNIDLSAVEVELYSTCMGRPRADGTPEPW